jgi:hypothetical protein
MSLSAFTAPGGGSRASSRVRAPGTLPPTSPLKEPPMSTDHVTRLQAADPAAGTSLPAERRAALLRQILDAAAADSPGVAGGVPRRPPSRPRRRALPLAIVGALAVTSGALAVAGVFPGAQTADEVGADYARAIKDIPLPANTRLPRVDFDHDALYAGRRAGYLTALTQADCAWWKEWRTAHGDGDTARQAAALRGQAKILALMPLAVSGQSEDIGGFTDSVFDAERKMRREAAAGDPTTVDQNIHANCTPGVRPGN